MSAGVDPIAAFLLGMVLHALLVSTLVGLAILLAVRTILDHQEKAEGRDDRHADRDAG